MMTTTTSIYPIPIGSKVNYQGHEWEIKAYWLGTIDRCLVSRYPPGETEETAYPIIEEVLVKDLEVVETPMDIEHPQGIFTPGQ